MELKKQRKLLQIAVGLASFLFPLSSFLFSSCTDQEETIRYTGERGLVVSEEISNHSVRDIVEDSLGHIWTATFRGVNRYDGYRYYSFFAASDSVGLPENQCNDLLYDQQGRLWVVTVNGVAYYNKEGDFTRVPFSQEEEFNTQGLLENSQGDIISFSERRLCLYNPARNCFETKHRMDEANRETFVLNAFIDRNDKLWVVTSAAISCYDSHTLSREREILLRRGENVPDLPAASFFDGDSKAWLSYWGGLYWFDLRSRQIMEAPACFKRDIDLSHDRLVCLQKYAEGYLFSTIKRRLYYYNVQTQTVCSEGDPEFPIAPVNAQVRSMFVDRHDNLWLGTEWNGLLVRYHKQKQFNNESRLQTLIGGRPVLSVTTDGDRQLWAATGDGQLSYYNMTQHAGYPLTIDNLPEGEQGNFINCLYHDQKGRLWAATGDRIMLLQPAGERRMRVAMQQTLYMPLSITEDTEGQLWISNSSANIYRLNPETGELTPKQAFSTDFTFISDLTWLEDGSLLMAAFGQEPVTVNPHTVQTSRIDVRKEDLQRSILRTTFIPSCLYTDKHGLVWAGTVSNGLLCLNPKEGRLNRVEGFPCSDICSIEEDERGRLWVSTMFGLCCYDPTHKTINTYYKNDGTGGNQFHDRCSARFSDGTLIFGGTHGLTMFNPSQDEKVERVNVAFQQLLIHNKTVKPGKEKPIAQRMSLCPEIHIAHNENAFAITYSALDYSEHSRVHYRYQLEGWDQEFVEADDRHEAYYANLSAGHYTFRVEATDGDRIVGEASIDVHVKVAPWRSWWAWTIYLLLAALIGWQLWRLRQHIQKTRREKQRAEQEKAEEQRINQMNMSFFSNISHEFRTPLTMIAGPVQQIASASNLSSEQHALLNIVQRSINRMLRLVGQIMDFGKLDQDALKLKVRQGDVIRELRATLEVFKAGAQEKHINVTSTGLDGTCLVWFDGDKLEKIVSNLMSNAIKFTPQGGTVTLHFDITDTQMRIAVSDTGPGIPEEKREQIFERYAQLDNQTRLTINWGTGIGLYYTRRLAQLHHGAVWVEDNPAGQGSSFVCTLPTNADAYTEEERTPAAATQQEIYPLEQYEPAQPAEDIDAELEDDERDTLLIVDDDPDVVSYLRALLSSTYHVDYRFDADSAYQAALDLQPSLILSDVAMPGRSGNDLCRQIKDDEQLCHIPVILITAKTTVADQLEGLGAGADAYVTKPFNPDLLQAIIGSQLSNRRKAQAILKDATDTNAQVEDVLTPQDKALMQKLYELLEESLSNADLDVTNISARLGLSRTKLYYKIKGLTGDTPSSFFKNYKLNRAAQLIQEGQHDISEIAYMTGFNTLSHFSSSFKKKYGVSPRDYK